MNIASWFINSYIMVISWIIIKYPDFICLFFFFALIQSFWLLQPSPLPRHDKGRLTSLCIPHPTVKGVMKYSLTLAYSITNEHTDSKWLTGEKKASKIKSSGNHIWFYIWHEALKDNWRMTSRKEEMHPHLYNSSSSISNICLMPKGKNQTN